MRRHRHPKRTERGRCGPARRVIASGALCGIAIVGCGGSSAHPAGSSAHPAASRIDDLCATPCTDGREDYVDRVRILPNTTAGSGAVVAMRLRMKNASSETITVEPRLEIELVDSRQHSGTPDNTIVQYEDRPARPPECPDLDSVTLVPDDSHAFDLCFGVADRNDLPRVLLLPEGAEVPLR